MVFDRPQSLIVGTTKKSRLTPTLILLSVTLYLPLFNPTMSTPSNQPNTTLYINNLNDKVNKEELRSQLFALFTTYGKIIDIVASKSQRMRGQAFLIFTDLAGATSAMRACEGMVFYDKPLVSASRLMRERVFHPITFCSTLTTQKRNHMRR